MLVNVTKCRTYDVDESGEMCEQRVVSRVICRIEEVHRRQVI